MSCESSLKLPSEFFRDFSWARNDDGRDIGAGQKQTQLACRDIEDMAMRGKVLN
jgi:hypothetical protein